ncbi:hypothetical protein EGT07_02685 [Herbaspirillum sp. HC18]|nr:hypothetical protein EGT07_02685 [Herbaspirillum sp. HC18]
MSTIIAARFQQQSQIEDTIDELERAGFERARISSFYVNPPGQHDSYPLGGDHAKSAGAMETDKGVAIGATTGAAAGLAAAPFLGPVGPLVGAHVGGLVGGLSEMKEQGVIGNHAEDAENAEPLRHSGLLLAIAIDDMEHEDRAIGLLRSLGAGEIERTEGTIENGDWTDFDPTATPDLMTPVADQFPPGAPNQRV